MESPPRSFRTEGMQPGSSYNAQLPPAFPYITFVPLSWLRGHLMYLAHDDDIAPGGSSFAVTVDGKPGIFKVWLSEVSYKRLRQFPAIQEAE